MVSINTTKSAPPALPGITRRVRLDRLLDAHDSRRIVLIVGQAAQGKSTLVAGHLAAADRPTVWLHLDAEDSDHANFFQLLVQAVTRAFSDMAQDTYLDALPVTFGPKKDLRRYRDKIRRLLEPIGVPFYLVLDGLDQLAPECTTLKVLDWLLEQMPTGGTAYLISRSRPPLRLERYRIRQELFELDNGDLAFTIDEIARFFEQKLGHSLSRKQTEEIFQITEGWIGGLVLIAEAVHREPSEKQASRLATLSSHDARRETLGYFSEEIFMSQSEDVREFLLIASHLDVIDPRVLSSLATARVAEDMLEGLVSRNLFIHVVHDPEHGRRYRFHQLFRDFLRSRFKRTYTPEQQQERIVGIADDLRQSGQMAAAISLYHQADQHEGVAAAVRKIGTDLIIRERYADLRRYLEMLPRSMREADAWLRFFWTLCRRFTKGPRHVEAFSSLKQEFSKTGDVRGLLLTMAYQIEAAVFSGLPAGQVMAMVNEAEKHLIRQRDLPYFAYAKTLLWMQIGFGYFVVGGHTARGLDACRRAGLLAERIGNRPLRDSAMIISVYGHIAAGDFQQAARALDSVNRSGEHGVSPEYRAFGHILNAELALHDSRFDDARRTIVLLEAEIQTYDLLFIYPLFIDINGRLKVCMEDLDGAMSLGRHLAEIAALSENPFLDGLAHRLSGLVQYHREKHDRAEAQLGAAFASFAAHDATGYHARHIMVLRALVYQNLGRWKESVDLLDAADANRPDTGSPDRTADVHIARALAYAGSGRRQGARDELALGFRLLKEGAAGGATTINRADFARAFMLAEEMGVDSGGAVSEIVQRGGEPLSAVQETIDPAIGDSGDVLPDRPPASRRVRTRMLRIQTLGEFKVVVGNGGTIPDNAWHGRKPKTLFKSILVHGVRDIPKDVLVEDLWPDSHPDTGYKNFKVTLHRLRKALEPDLAPGNRSAYIHLRDNRVSLDPDLCRIDVETFLAAWKKVKRLEGSADAATLLPLCETAAERYGGEFLPEEPYAPWIEIKRSALRENYLALLHLMGDLCESSGATDRAIECFESILQTDPGVEVACQRLMALYAAGGRRHAAIRLYQSFAQYTQTYLGIAPDPATTALYHRVAGSG